MRHVLLIAAKDLRQRARDRSLFLFALLLPLGLTVLMNSLLSGVDGATPFHYAVVDDDRGPVAASFVDDVLPAAGEVVGFRVVATADEARRLVADGEVAAAFLVPAGFSDAVVSGRAAAVEVVGGADAPLGTQVARSLARSFTDRLTSVRVAVAGSVHGGSALDPAELARRAARLPVPPPVAEDDVGRRQLDMTTYYAAGMAVFFLFFTVQFGVTSLLDERRGGTLPRLLAAPLRPASVLLAKLLTSAVIGVASMAVLVVATTQGIGARWGHPLGVALLVVAGVLAATGVVAVVAVSARTADQAGGRQAAVAVTLGALGGTFFPVAQVGGVLAAASYVSPHRWFLRGLSELASGEVVAVLPAVGALCAFAAVGLGLALSMTRKAVRP
ncbi:Linearmycin resistance permease protein LnrM [Actinosynnema sp. ALI-1.44]